MLTPSATPGLEGLHSSRLPMFTSQEQQHPPTAVRPLRRRMLLATTCAVTAPKLWQSVKGVEWQRKEIQLVYKFGTTILWWLFRGAATRESPAKAYCNSIMLHFVPIGTIGTKKKCRCSRKNASSCLCWRLWHGNCVQIFVNSTMKNCHLFLTRDQMRSAMFESWFYFPMLCLAFGKTFISVRWKLWKLWSAAIQ